ncbi:MAG: hypothetical protein OSB14_02010, partial [Planctomycetota bacterium]|nr:hypothetical protein [Planctomycetota bacterium]
MMLYAPILLSVLLALQGDGTAEESESSTWGDVELPVGFYLDLATGMVSNQAPQDPLRWLTWDGDSLQGPALLMLTPGASERDVLTRGEGGELRPGEPVFLDTALLNTALLNTALLNTEWTYELGELGWGYLRALEVEARRISLERAHRDVDQIELSRIPTEISWSSEGEGIELSWPQHSEEGARWFVERRELSSGVNTAWSSAGVSLESTWTDEEAKPDVVYEYRVVLAGNGWGARVRAVAGGMLDELIEAPQGVGVNALSGEIDGARSDLRVEFINPKGVQISPGAGVEMRTLTQSGRDAWEVPSNDVPGYGPQRYFISEGRDLALHLPEGIYARVSLSKIEDGKAELRINVDLDGGRVLLPAPTLKSAEWLASGEVKVRGSVLNGHESLGLGEPSLILEVERGYLSEEWSIVTERTLSEAESLLDPDPGKAGLRRYRVRARIGSHRLSAPSAPVSLLLGDDGGRGAEEWIRKAVDELGKPDYSRRQRAREVLAVIGARARPFLLDVVSSSNPEQAAAARELLSGLGETEESAEAVEMHLPEVLMKRASELGLTEERLPGFLDPDPALRALAVFKAIDPESVRAHLELLADSDSEGFVREAAEIALSLPTRRMEPGQISTLHPEALSAISEELDAFGAPDVGLLADSFFAAAAGLDAWQVLVSFQVAMDLRASRGSALDEDAAVRRARLVLALLSDDHERGDAPASFLAAALDVVGAPLARQEAGRALAVKVFAARKDVDEPLRVAAGDFSDLASILDACRRSGKGEQIIIPEGVYEASGGGLSSLR